MILIHGLVTLLGALVIFNEPSQWDALRWASAYGYPEWAGNIVAVILLFVGDKAAHEIWESIKKISPYLDKSVG